MSLWAAQYPLGDVLKRVDTKVYPSTEQNYIRLRSRLIAYRAESSGTGYGWRLGNTRIEARKDGRR